MQRICCLHLMPIVLVFTIWLHDNFFPFAPFSLSFSIGTECIRKSKWLTMVWILCASPCEIHHSIFRLISLSLENKQYPISVLCNSKNHHRQLHKIVSCCAFNFAVKLSSNGWCWQIFTYQNSTNENNNLRFIREFFNGTKVTKLEYDNKLLTVSLLSLLLVSLLILALFMNSIWNNGRRAQGSSFFQMENHKKWKIKWFK